MKRCCLSFLLLVASVFSFSSQAEARRSRCYIRIIALGRSTGWIQLSEIRGLFKNHLKLCLMQASRSYRSRMGQLVPRDPRFCPNKSFPFHVTVKVSSRRVTKNFSGTARYRSYRSCRKVCECPRGWITDPARNRCYQNRSGFLKLTCGHYPGFPNTVFRSGQYKMQGGYLYKSTTVRYYSPLVPVCSWKS